MFNCCSSSSSSSVVVSSCSSNGIIIIIIIISIFGIIIIIIFMGYFLVFSVDCTAALCVRCVACTSICNSQTFRLSSVV